MAVDWPVVFSGVRTVLDPLASASWPIALGAVAYGFRQPISKLLDRVKSFSGWGATLDTAPRQDALTHQQDAIETTVTTPVTIDPNAMPLADPVFGPMDYKLLEALDKVLPADDRLKLAWAVRQHSISEASRLHEAHYRMIFGSQIHALLVLNQSVQGDVELFRRFYLEKVLAAPVNAGIHQGRTFEQWGDFLVQAGYVEVVQGSDPEQVRITPFGRHFCGWLAHTGASQQKPG